MVSVVAREGSALPSREITQDYDVILMVGKPLGSLVVWDTICRDNKVAFFAAVSRGSQAFFFTDLGDHSYQAHVRLQLLPICYTLVKGRRNLTKWIIPLLSKAYGSALLVSGMRLGDHCIDGLDLMSLIFPINENDGKDKAAFGCPHRYQFSRESW